MTIKTRTRYAIIGGDFSGQEPRSLCAFSQDKDMQAAYIAKQDLYAAIAAKCFHNNYEDNLEFQPRLVEDDQHEELIDVNNNIFTVLIDDLLETDQGWVEANKLATGNLLKINDTNIPVKNISRERFTVKIEC